MTVVSEILPLSGHIVVSGPVGSGRTNLQRSLIGEIRRANPEGPILLVSPERSWDNFGIKLGTQLRSESEIEGAIRALDELTVQESKARRRRIIIGWTHYHRFGEERERFLQAIASHMAAGTDIQLVVGLHPHEELLKEVRSGLRLLGEASGMDGLVPAILVHTAIDTTYPFSQHYLAAGWGHVADVSEQFLASVYLPVEPDYSRYRLLGSFTPPLFDTSCSEDDPPARALSRGPGNAQATKALPM